MQVQTVIHGGLTIHSTSFKAKTNLLQKPQPELKKKKASLEKLRLALSIPGNLAGKMLFIHIPQGEVIPRGSPDLAFYLPPLIQSIRSKSLPQPQTGDRARKAVSDWLGFPASVS